MKNSRVKKMSTYFLLKKLKLVTALLSLALLCGVCSRLVGAKHLFSSMLHLPQVIFSLFTFFMPNAESLQYLGEITYCYFRSVGIAVSSTVFAALFALIFALLCADVSKRGFFLPIIIRFFASLCRNIPLPAQVILFLFAFGQNELTGFFVLFVVTLGALTRIFRELIENTSATSFLACTACGASYIVSIAKGILPNIHGKVLSWLLYALATNIRDSALVGILSGSGIGFLFTLFFRSFRYEAAGFVVAVMLLTVILFDLVAKKLRHFMLESDGCEAFMKMRRRLSNLILFILFTTSLIFIFFIKTDGKSFLVMFFSLFSNIRSMFFSKKTILSVFNFSLFTSCGVSLVLAFLATVLSALIALPLAMLNTSHLFGKRIWSTCIEAFFSFVRSVPTIIWVMLFSVALGVGATSTIIGMLLHSIAYLFYAFSMSFDSKAREAKDALVASGVPLLVVFMQAIWPSSLRDVLSWVFFRFEINFANAVALGSAAGAGGIGYELFIAGSMEFDIASVGTITYILLIATLILEATSSQLKKNMSQPIA